MMRLSELRERLQRLNAEGFVPTERSGPTGIGHTLETRLGLSENNLPIPDIGGRVEVKATRSNTSNLITLFTFNRAVWKFKNKELVERWGYFDDTRDRPALYTTVSATDTNALGLQLSVSEDGNELFMTHVPTETLLASWDMYYIVGKFVTKFERMLFVHADSKIVDDKEYFHYDEAEILSEPSSLTFRDGFANGIVTIDIRMYLRPSGAARNHGTGFRILEQNLPRLFGKVERLV
ncbi:MAG: hypothetical protein F4Y88_02315 [Chloroflexi bacterium]|nr:hypothetical protein [Chloroflexota bacterium]